MTLADLEAYRAVERKPIEGSYRGYPIKSPCAAVIGRR